MEELKQGLRTLFDEMLPKTKSFKSKTYEQTFSDMMDAHSENLRLIEEAIYTADEEQQLILIKEFGAVIPEYAKSKTAEMSKNQLNAKQIDFNMNMAAYVIPAIRYGDRAFCKQIAEETVKQWNEKKVTGLTLQTSTYEDISGGFKKKLCYITTAVCAEQGKPDNCQELEILRNYRDTYLMHSLDGRALVEEYYEIAPVLVMMLDMQKNRQELYGEIYEESLLPCLEAIASGDYEGCKDKYKAMVNGLRGKYLPS
ncbi:hypothetical protein M2145_000398 [Lachnospiraceae bacterium PF1-21]|uniref:CFI-box-CTERM domain-containing protein n=1 Tax=Ohessyouella blattaphilus TaxID=2949333 RepID=UPI003E251CC7